MKTDQFRRAMEHALTRYDEKQSRKRGWNPYALPQYLARIDDICADIERGANPAKAICAGFSGPLATACLRACKLKREDPTAQGAWHYVPETK